MDVNFVQSTFLDFLVIPDVHCRTFWKDAVEKNLLKEDTPLCTTHIVFLGDYLDGYPNEWDDDSYRIEGIDRLEEIIDIKKSHPHQVKLLLGNHDCGYAINPDICSSRMDSKNYPRISKLFQDNRNCFQIMYKHKGILFSHAGVHKGFLDDTGIDSKHFVEVFNNAWEVEDMNTLCTLGLYDNFRGFSLNKYGSPVWADVRSFLCYSTDPDGTKPISEGLGFQVFGHTQLDKPIVADTEFACLDCCRGFLIDEKRNFLDPFTLEPVDCLKLN